MPVVVVVVVVDVLVVGEVIGIKGGHQVVVWGRLQGGTLTALCKLGASEV